MAGRRFFFILLILFFGLGAQGLAASYPLIVQIAPEASITSIAATLGGTVVDSIPGANTYLLNVPFLPPPVTMSLLGIQWMELNRSATLPRFALREVVEVPATAAADWYKDQPAMQLIKAGSARAYSTGTGVVVADINSSLDYAHQALAGHLTSGYDFLAGRPPGLYSLDSSEAGFLDQIDSGFLDQISSGFLDQIDSGFLDHADPNVTGRNPAYGHGTASAGIIAAIAPGSMIMPLRAFDDDGRSDLFTLAKAIRFAVSHGAQVINLIFGTLNPSPVIDRAVGFALSSNVLVVGSAGNRGTSQPEYPAALNRVMTAAATDLSDTKAYFSNYGSHVFVAAPGVDIISAYPLGYYSLVSGTSFSAAALAATAAVVRSVRTTGVPESIAGGSVKIDAQNPNQPGQLGSGRIDVLAAILGGTPAITSVNPSRGEQGRSLTISVTGRSTHFDQARTHLSLGGDLTTTNLVVASPTSLTAHLDIAANATVGTRTLTVTTGAEVVTLNNGFTVTAGLPVIATVTPNSGQQGQNVTLAVAGQFTHFAQGTSQVVIDGITVNSVTVTDATSLTAYLTIPAPAAVGSRTLTITTGSEVATLSSAFSVTPGTAVIVAVSPNTGKQADTVTAAITGQFTHFAQGTTQLDFGPDFSVTALTVHNATSLSAQLAISRTASVGSRHLTVTTAAEVITLDNAFTVGPGTPAITTANPNIGRQGDSVTVNINGQFTGFVQGTTQVSLGDGVIVNSVGVSSSTGLTAQATVLPTAAIGGRNVTVITGAEVVTLSNGFTVTARPPVIATVLPGSGQQGQNLTLAVSGEFTHFAQGVTQVSIDGIAVNSVTVTDATSLAVHLTIPAAATAGSRTLTVVTGSEVATLGNAFSVTPGTAVITAVSPNTGKQNDTVTVAITGQFTHFSQGVTQIDLGPGLVVTALAVQSSTTLTAQLVISSTAVAGPRDVTVTTASEVVNLNNAFSVTPGIPVITTMNPGGAQQGDSVTVNIVGRFTNFVAGATQVSLGGGVIVSGVGVSSSTGLTVQATVLPTAAVGARNVTVITGGEVVTLNNGFTVTARPPVVTTVLPGSGQQGQNLTLAVTGEFTHFAQGATQVSIDGITVNSVMVTDATLLTAYLTIPAGATLGSRTLTVITGNEATTLSNAFSVAPATPVTPE